MNLGFSKASKAYGSTERVFEYRLTCAEALVAGNPDQKQVMMEAMVLPNALCVLVVPHPVLEGLRSAGGPIDSITFDNKIMGLPKEEEEEEGNKKKKGIKVATKSPVCTIALEDGSSMCLHSPVSGKVLELNKRLSASPNLILSSGFEGYTAVVQPDEKLAKLIKLQS